MTKHAEELAKLGWQYFECPACGSEGARAFPKPEQEPVAWHTEDHLTDRSATTYSKDMVYRWECKGWPVTPLYTTPPQRTWVWITDDEIEKMGLSNYIKVVRETEAKLKEKNT